MCLYVLIKELCIVVRIYACIMTSNERRAANGVRYTNLDGLWLDGDVELF